ncbi:DUF350 domain-containing protein [Candidatus Falkowbacteria bacterium]|nr:DUF350 domain-containing protein [Candidatus Falkowbacteria bacterium]
MNVILADYIYLLGDVLVMGIILALSLIISVWIINRTTVELHLWKELRRKNLAVGLFLAGLVIAMALIVK